MTEAALRQRRRNLRRRLIRSDRETAIIKRLIWQSCFDGGERLSQRALARQLGVCPSYVSKVQRKALREGMDALVEHGQRITAIDLEEARRFTEKVRAQEPGLLAPVPTRRLYEGEAGSEHRRFSHAMTADEIIAEQRRFAEEWKRKNPPRYHTRRRISVPNPR
jgi:hypothetical protein